MKRVAILVTFLLISLSIGLPGQQGAPKPKRINKIIELWEQGQPVYYVHSQGGYQEGLKMAQTWADYVNYEMEHGLFDLGELREFMRGLVAGGPTKSGHRTPAVIVTLPVGALDEATIRNNYWVFQQTMATGVHGILLCHARSPEGVARFVESVRFPFFKIGVGSRQAEGRIAGQRRSDLPCSNLGHLGTGVSGTQRYLAAQSERRNHSWLEDRGPLRGCQRQGNC